MPNRQLGFIFLALTLLVTVKSHASAPEYLESALATYSWDTPISPKRGRVCEAILSLDATTSAKGAMQSIRKDIVGLLAAHWDQILTKLNISDSSPDETQIAVALIYLSANTVIEEMNDHTLTPEVARLVSGLNAKTNNIHIAIAKLGKLFSVEASEAKQIKASVVALKIYNVAQLWLTIRTEKIWRRLPDEQKLNVITSLINRLYSNKGRPLSLNHVFDMVLSEYDKI